MMTQTHDMTARAEALARHLHRDQTRKDANRTPYITHVAEVAGLVTAWGGTEAAIAAAWLHDTVEDCPPWSLADVTRDFGSEVAGLVAEVTDDKSLPKARRKELQILNAPHKSAAGALVGLADKTSNLRSLAVAPPAGWDKARRVAYVDWAEAVIGGLTADLPSAGRRDRPARLAGAVLAPQSSAFSDGLAAFNDAVRRLRDDFGRSS